MKIKLLFEELKHNYTNITTNNPKYTFGIKQQPWINTIDIYGNNMGFEMDIEEGEKCELKIVNGLLKSLGIDCELVM